MKWLLPAILVLAVFGALWPNLAGAQEPTVRIINTGPFPLIIDGVTIATFPFEAPLGGQACIIIDVRYSSDLERTRFQGWDHAPDGVISDECISLEDPGEYTAQYRSEVLLTINSQVRSQRKTEWVPRGVPFRVDIACETLDSGDCQVQEREGERFIFEQWSAGENRFNPVNTIVPNRPLTLEVTWTKEFFLDLEGPAQVQLTGVGWYRQGTNVVVRADAQFESEEEGVQLQFKDWEGISQPAILIPTSGRTLSLLSWLWSATT